MVSKRCPGLLLRCSLDRPRPTWLSCLLGGGQDCRIAPGAARRTCGRQRDARENGQAIGAGVSGQQDTLGIDGAELAVPKHGQHWKTKLKLDADGMTAQDLHALDLADPGVPG